MSDPELINTMNQIINKYSDSDFINNYTDESNYLMNLKDVLLGNYQKSIDTTHNITNKIDELGNQFEGRIEKINDLNQRKLEITRFYVLKYKKEIDLLQKIILMCGFGLIGCLLFNMGLISNNFLSLYLGLVLSIGFIIIFYNLWDIFIRDNNVFDEYDYGIYSTKSPTNVTAVNDDKYDNNELANLKC